jgi:hypothetical protein
MTLTNTVREKVRKVSLDKIRRFNAVEGANLYMNIEEVPTNHTINAGLQTLSVPRRTAFVLADLAPRFNWGHPCQHMLFDADTGELYESVEAQFPPAEYYTNRESFEAIATPVKPIDVMNARKLQTGPIPAITNALTNARGNRYAILFSGMSDNRHLNDLEFLYRTLIDVYGFNAANIQVLNENGTIHYAGAPSPIGNWPGDNTAYRMPVHGQGGATALRDAIRNLRTVLQEGDFLLIHTNNHGGHDGTQSDLSCWPNWDSYDASDFASELAALPAYDALMVMMEQCHSGGFMNPVINNSTAKWTHFSAACREDKNSIGGANFDPFAYDWIAAVTGQYADGSALSQTVDTNGDGRISAMEAHAYADAVKDPYDTPVSDETPSGCGNYLFLGYPAHDLFIRDNLDDHGREPLIDGGICMSPDVIIYNQELLEAQATLGSASAQDRDDLGEAVEYGQDNFIYLRVQNRGTSATSGSVKVYWSPPSTFPTPASWNLLGETAIPSLTPNEFKVAGPIRWDKDDIPATGHYCFIALVNSGSDPAPDKSMISTLTDFHNFIKESNNATWKNFNVIDMFAGSTNSMDFHIQGWPRTHLQSDLRIDLSELPSAAEVTLRILKRLTDGATLQGMTLVDESTLYREYQVASGQATHLRDIDLRPSDDSQATLEFVLPDTIADGGYRVHVAQIVDGLEVGRITQLLAVGEHPFVANRNSREVHLPDCIWVKRMSSSNKIAYDTVERATKHGFNGCHYCLSEYDTG